ncbi:MAG: enoyl-CoA hydratase [Desulfitobacteriaceae bacterium]|nr:enoyl-CoA hydratase [Desulfitobacteriaceae bacterium]MDI6914478.1 enoyl-CoA hydratase [Desulfitobacteriaceae bacterium]
MSDDFLFTKDEGIATITLNRPEKMNAFTLEMIDQWAEALRDCQADPDTKVVVVTGAGKAFCSGGDVTKMGRDGVVPLDKKNFLWEHVHQIALTIETMDKPVVAALNGLAIGAGLDMALMCDIRFAADSAKFSEGYVKVGLIPGDGGTYFLPRLVGVAKALELCVTGEFVDAEEAMRIGMVNKVFPADKLMEETYAFARKIANGPSLAIGMIRRAIYQNVRMELRTALDMISSHMAVIQFTDDHQEGVAAFRERRQPRFQGR